MSMSEIRVPSVASGDDVVQSETLTEQAYRLIRRDILSGALAAGTKLKIEALRARYTIGPTPIREALERLASERLAQAEQQRGFRVAAMTVRDLDELTDMRILLEGEALRRSIITGDYAWEGAIVSAFHKLDRLETSTAPHAAPDSDEWERRNSEFHGALIAAAGSDWLIRSHAHVEDHFGRYHRCLREALVTQDRDCHAEHRAIMEAALARDSDRTVQLAQRHIKRTAELIRPELQPRVPGRAGKR